MPDITTGLVGYWPFDEGTGSTANDVSGNANHGTITGATWENAGLGPALLFDGTGGVDLGSPTLLEELGDGDSTLACWVQSSSSSDGDLISICSPGDDGALLLQYDGSGFANTHIWTSGGFGGVNSNPDSIRDGNPHHVAQVVDGTTILVYIDGVLSTSGSISGTKVAGSGSVRLAARAGAATHVTGSMNQVRLYNRALDADDIAALYAYSGSDPELFITAAFTEPNETLSAAAVVTVTGSATFTEPNETLSSETDVLNTIDAAFTEPNETLSSTVAGATLITADFTEPNETLSSLVDNPVVLVGIQVPEPNETLTSAVNVIAGLDLSATEPDETLSSLTGVLVTAALDVTEANESLNSYTHHGDTPPSSGAAGHRRINISSMSIGL